MLSYPHEVFYQSDVSSMPKEEILMIVSVAICIIITALIMLPVLLWMRRKERWTYKRFVGYWMLAIYFSVVYQLTGGPTVDYIRWDPNVDLIPLLGMMGDIKNSLLNIALFVPLGLLLPLLWKRYRDVRYTLAFSFGLSLVIELSQLFTYRATDVDDLITNTLGGILGWCTARMLFKHGKEEKEKDRALLLLALGFGIKFLTEPIQALLYYVIT